MTRYAFLLLALCAHQSFSQALTQELPQTIDCSEVVHAQANDSVTNFEITRDKKFEITFSMISADEWIMSGNAGATPLVKIDGPDVVHFLESTPLGTVNITQIETTLKDGKYRAVHSRHPAIFGDIFPSQWLLTCEAR
jgi:hypothetical protein